jgi:DNA gyrase subunit B
MFLKLVPQLFKEGIIYRAIMPLYGAVKSKVFYPFYTEEDKQTFMIANPNIRIQRYKGLGEMNPDQLGVCLLDKNVRRLEQIPYPEKEQDIFDIMSSAELKRNLLDDSEDVGVSK